MPHDTIPARLLQRAKVHADRNAYFVRTAGGWQPTTWRDYVADVIRAARALVALGVGPGKNTCILGFNRPEWAIFDLATMCTGAAPAGIYTTCSPEEVAYIVGHADAPVVLVENAAQWAKIDKQRQNLPALRHVVLMRGAGRVDDPLVLSWEDFLARADDVPEREVHARIEALEPTGLATLIYTSGTTGPPKGVMLSHRNLAWTAQNAVEIVASRDDDCGLSYLPLSHIAEQMFTLHVPVTTGAAVYFAESLEKVPDNLKEVQPTVFFGVPRIWEKFHAGVAARLSQAKGIKAKLAGWAMGVAGRVNEGRRRGQEPSGLLALQYGLATKLVFSKLKPALGLGRARICVSGAAPIGKDVLEFMARLDILIHEVYGQSEDTGPTSFNVPGKTKFGTVGPPIPGVEVRIAEDGEILVRGPNVFLGYFKDPAATAETLVDGWLHSGDLGAFDADGFLTITGRKKEILITSGGKNIAPKNIEEALKESPLVAEAVVVGDRRHYLTALIVLDPEAAQRRAQELGQNGQPPHQSPAIRAEVQRLVDAVNEKFARVEHVRKFTVLPRAFTIEDGELTPTLKVKRKVVYQHFAPEIEAMYADGAGG